jgi:hypothetical protein
MEKKVMLLLAGVAILLPALNTACVLEPMDGLDRTHSFDPRSPEYQGYHTVDHPDQIRAHITEGAQILWPELVVSEVLGATGYQLQIAADRSFSEDAILYYGAVHQGNVMQPLVDAGLISGTQYYWRGRAIRTTPGAWTEPRSFTMESVTGMSPADGSTISVVRPTVRWNAVGGATGYQLQFARSTDSLHGGDVRSTSGTSMRFPFELSRSEPVSHWRIRAVNADDDLLGGWSTSATISLQHHAIDIGGAVAHFTFDRRDLDGANLIDLTGTRNARTVDIEPGQEAINGEGFGFNGSTAYLALGSSGDNPFRLYSSISQVIVVRPAESTEVMPIFDYGIQTADVNQLNYGYRVRLVNGKEVSMRVQQAVSFETDGGVINRGEWRTGLEIAPNQWNKIILRRSDRRAEVRLVTENGSDETAIITYNGSPFIRWRSTNYAFIGAERHASGAEPTLFFDGKISEFVLFDRYLTDAEVEEYARTPGAYISRPE